MSSEEKTYWNTWFILWLVGYYIGTIIMSLADTGVEGIQALAAMIGAMLLGGLLVLSWRAAYLSGRNSK